jgi:hypothetical protein
MTEIFRGIHQSLQANAMNIFEKKYVWPGCAIAQAVSRWLTTMAAQLCVRAEHVGFVVDKVALGKFFYEYFSFTCQSPFHQFLHHHNHPGLAQ